MVLLVKNFLAWGSRFFVLASLLSPVAFSPFVFFPFITSKVILFRVLIEVSLLFYIPLVLFFKEFRFRFSRLSIAFFCFFLVLFVSSFVSPSFRLSLFGSIERGEGLFSLFHLVCLFVLLSSLFRSSCSFFRVFHFFLFSCSFLSLSVVLQFFSIIPRFSDDPGRFSGLVGNTDFVSSLAFFGIFVSLYLVFCSRHIVGRLVYSSLLLLNFFALVFSASRGGFLAFGVSCFVFLLVFSIPFKFRLVLSSFLLVLGLVVILIIPRFHNVQGFLDKSRLFAYPIVFSSFLENPRHFFIGSGVESEEYAYQKYFKESYQPILTREQSYDRFHNKLLDVLVEGGLLGILSYLAIFFFAFFKLKKYGGLFFVAPVFIAYLVAYFTQNLFIFDTLTGVMGFVIVLVFITKLTPNDTI